MDGKSVDQPIRDFLLMYRNTLHTTTKVASAMLFLKITLCTRLDVVNYWVTFGNRGDTVRKGKENVYCKQQSQIKNCGRR